MKRFKTQQIYLLFIFILGSFFITGCGGGGDVTGHWLPARQLMSIQVTPATASVPVTGTQQFTATAIYSDGSSLDVTKTATWTSGTPVNASVGLNTGVATGNVGGTSTIITAAYGDKSGSATLNVNAATSAKFEVKPTAASIPVSGTQQYTAIETFSDGTSYDRTTASVWTAPDLSGSGVATISNTSPTIGVAIGAVIGTSTITAKYTVGSITKTATAILTVNAATSLSFKVTPATASIPVSGTQQYTATETFSDGTTFDRTAASAWTAPDLSGSGVATISNTSPTIAVATGVKPGTSTITAKYTVGSITKTATAILTVNAATATKFEVIPATASMPVTGTQQFTALETFSDGTSIDRTAVSA